MKDNAVFTQIEQAYRIFRSQGKRLLATPAIGELLLNYDSAIEATQRTMGEAGMGLSCGRCSKDTGSCCFQEVETWYDHRLLLINLLLSGDLPRSRQIRGECLFLGEQGCRLRARYAFCLNYFCPMLKARFGPDLLRTLLAAVGRELAAGWELGLALNRRFTLLTKIGPSTQKGS